MEILLKNIGSKVLALIFALALWFFVTGEKGSEISFLIPLELKGVPSNLMITNEVSSNIDVRISGPKTLLAGLSPSQLGVTLDLSNSKSGNNVFQIFPEDVKVSRGLEVKSVNPRNIKVVLESLITKKLPVQVYLTGRLKKGFKLGKVQVDPMVVEVTGVEKGLKGLKSLRTRAIDINGLDKGIEEKVLLDLSGLNIIKIDSETVEVKLNVQTTGG